MRARTMTAIFVWLLTISVTGCAMPTPVSSTSAATAAPTISLMAAATYAPEPTPIPSPTTAVKPSTTPTPFAASTIMPTATQSSTPTSTPTPTTTPSIPHVVVLKTINIRGGPGTNYAVVASGKTGAEYEVCGRNQAGDWVQLCGYGDPQRWVYVGADLKLAEVVGLQGGQQLKLVDPIPTPPLPTNTPDPCFGATARDARQRFAFEAILSCLKTPALVSEFMRNNVKWDGGYDPREHGGNEYAPAWLVYERGIDDCDGHAILQCYLLERNGWDAYVVGLSIEGGGKEICGECPGHDVCAVSVKDGRILVMDNEGTVEGYFGSLPDVARHYIAKGWMWKGGSLRTMLASQVTQVTTDYTTPKVTDLPWTSHEY